MTFVPVAQGPLLALSLFIAGSVLAADWSSCESDLGRLRRRASDASSSASSVSEEADRMDRKRRDLANCQAYPAVFDLMRDRCNSVRWDYDSARTSFESAKSTLESNLGGVDSVLRSVASSCDYTFTVSGYSKPTSGDSFCRMLQEYKGRLPPASLLEMCKKSRSEEECRKCLQ